MSTKEVFRFILTDKVVLCIFLSACFRQISQLNWAYFKNQFFENYHGLSKTQIAEFLSWEPIVGGIFGATVLGYCSDR